MSQEVNHINVVRQMLERAGTAGGVEQALRWLLEQLDEVIDGVKAFILLEPDGETLHIMSASGLSTEFIGKYERSVGHGMLGEVVLGGRLRGIREADPTSEDYKDLKLEHPFGSALAAPLSAGNQHLGYLWVESTEPHAFELSDLNLTSVTGLIAGMIISHMRIVSECASLMPVDKTTGLLRNAEFTRRVRLEVQRAKRTGGTVSLLMLHVDGLTRIRARSGDEEVERIEKELARTFGAALRGIDFVGLQGAGRMFACLPDAPPEAAVVAAKRTLELMSGVTSTDTESLLSVHLGLSNFPKDCESGSSLIATASDAAHTARKLNDGTVAQYTKRDK